MVNHKPLAHHLPRMPHGEFGAVRKYDIHTGIDLYCDAGDVVSAIEDGIVVAVEAFTGPEANSPWWNYTQSVLVESASGVICYGEISTSLNIGDVCKAGDKIGYVQQVLRVNKGLPMSMLHLELYKHGTTKSVVWNLNEEKPEELLDPSILL